MEHFDYNSLVLAFGAMGFGIMLLIRGGDWTIDSAVFVATRYGLSKMVVGFTIVAFGTSLPELVVSVLANLQGSPGIAIGNVMGSNIANILMVLGITSMLVPLVVHVKAVLRDMIAMLAATAILIAVMLHGDITQMIGFGLLAILIGYVLFQYKTTTAAEMEEEIEDPEYDTPLQAYIFLFLGLIAISLGAEFLVRGAKLSAEVIGVPEAIIALSLIALGTSLPELSTCISAGRKGHSDLLIGNILGSNVFNIMMIIGASAAVKPILNGTYAEQLVNFDIWVVTGVAVILAAILLTTGKLGRTIGVTFFAGYIAYNIYIYLQYIS